MSIKDLVEQVRQINDSKDKAFCNGWNGACDAIYGSPLYQAALSPPERTEGQIEAAITKAMSWRPSENGPSYSETRAEVLQMLRAMPLQEDAKS